MGDRSHGGGPSRRGFLKATAAGVGAASLPSQGCGPGSGSQGDSAPRPRPEADEREGPLFSARERRALAALADRVLPGAGAWGAVEYIERTLTLFEHDPPRLYAGSMGSTDEWLPFDRVRERAWRLRIYGSGEVEHPNEAELGPVRGLRPLLLEGARVAADALDEGASPDSAEDLLDADFHEAFTELVLEGSLGDPTYGGNRDGASWRAFHFESPIFGYGVRPALAPTHGSHPAGEDGSVDPLRWSTRVAFWLLGFFSRRID